MLRNLLILFVLFTFVLTVFGTLTVIPLYAIETGNFAGVETIVQFGTVWSFSVCISPHPSVLMVFGDTLLQWSKAEGFVFDQIELIPGAAG